MNRKTMQAASGSAAVPIASKADRYTIRLGETSTILDLKPGEPKRLDANLSAQ